MSKATRAIIIEDGKILVMYRNKYGSEYFTLVGGKVGSDEDLEASLARELFEETGLELVRSRHVYTELHAAPYNEQYIYLCEVAPHGDVALQEYSEEEFMNRLDANIHKPLWVPIASFGKLSFLTPQLQTAILEALKKDFPTDPVTL